VPAVAGTASLTADAAGLAGSAAGDAIVGKPLLVADGLATTSWLAQAHELDTVAKEAPGAAVGLGGSDVVIRGAVHGTGGDAQTAFSLPLVREQGVTDTSLSLPFSADADTHSLVSALLEGLPQSLENMIWDWTQEDG
jgi:hypothetical protein